MVKQIFLCCQQLAQSVIELNNQIQQKDKEIQSNEAKLVSEGLRCCVGVWVLEREIGRQRREDMSSIAVFSVSQDVGVSAADQRSRGRLPGLAEPAASR